MITKRELEWRSQAACRGFDQHFWYGETQGISHIRPAKKICEQCEVSQQCLQYALDHDEDYGIWGGLTTRERNNYRRRHGLKVRGKNR